MYKFFFYLLLFYSGISLSQTNDSLLNIYKNNIFADTTRLNALQLYCSNFINNNIPDSAIKYAQIGLKFAKEKKLPVYEATAYRITARGFGNKFDGAKSLEYILKALKISEQIGDKKGLAKCYIFLGPIYSQQKNEQKSLEYRLKAVKIAEEIGDKNLTANFYLNIGGFYMGLDLKKSLDYKFKALNIFENLKDNKNIGIAYNQIGNTYLEMDDPSKALEYYKKAHQNAVKINDLKQYASDFGSIGMAYNNLKEYKLAMQFLDSSEKFNELYDHNMWGKLNNLKQMEEAFAGLKQFDKAYLVKKQSDAIEDSLFNDEGKAEVRKLTQNFENEKKIIEEEKLKTIQIEEKKRQTLIIFAISIVLILTLFFAIVILSRFRVIKKQKQVIEIKSIETEEQKKLIEEKNNEVLSSIRYAKRIQISLLPTEKYIKRVLSKKQN